MQWIFVLCGRMFLLSLIATYQVCTVSLKAGLYTYNCSGADGPQHTLFGLFVTSSPVGRSSPMACVPGMAQHSRGGSPRARDQRSRRRGAGHGRASRGGVWRKPTPDVRGDVQEPDRRGGTTRDAWARAHQVRQPRVGGAGDIRRLGTDRAVSDPGRSAGGAPARRPARGGLRADRQAGVRRGPSRPGAGEAREAPHGRQAGSRSGGAATRVGRRPERRAGGRTAGGTEATPRHRRGSGPARRGGVKPRWEPRAETRRWGRRAGGHGAWSGALAARPWPGCRGMAAAQGGRGGPATGDRGTCGSRGHRSGRRGGPGRPHHRR
jgi:hypothetical protein